METLRREKTEREVQKQLEEFRKVKEEAKQQKEKIKTLTKVVEGVVDLAKKEIDKARRNVSVRKESKSSVLEKSKLFEPSIPTKKPYTQYNPTLIPSSLSQNNFAPLRPLTITPPLFPLLTLTNFILILRLTFSNLFVEMSTARRPPPEPPPNTTLPYLICG